MGRRSAAGVLLVLALVSWSQAALDPEVIGRCKQVRAKVVCDGSQELADLLRTKYPTIPESAEMLDVAHVIATKYPKVPRYVARQALQGYTYDIPPTGKAALEAKWCRLPGEADNVWPTIIGGIGDSGTRGAAMLLKDGFGYSMCPGDGGCNKAGDNTVFFKLSGKEVLLSGNGSIQTDLAADPLQTVPTLAMLCLGLNETLSRVVDVYPEKVPGHWGWKSPRSLYYAPYFNTLLRGKFRVIHVIRDGRDVATGSNQMQFGGLCMAAFDNDTMCARTPPNALRFWGKMNSQVYEYGTKVLGKDRYFPLRIEDFVLGPDKDGLMNRLHKFLRLQKPLTQEELSKSIGIGEGHEHSYGGNRFPAEKRKELLAQCGSIAHDELKLLGYRLDDWGTAGPALDLRSSEW